MDLKVQKQQAAFAAELAQLEEKVGEFLTGVGWDRCFAAFNAEPDAFAFLVRKAMNRFESGYSKSPLGLLVLIVRDELEATAERLKAGKPLPSLRCPECDVAETVGHAGDCSRRLRAA